MSTDGIVNITVSPAGSYTFAWSNGATTEDINGVGVGSYTVTVTNSTTGCYVIDTYALPGPGGCNICPNNRQFVSQYK